MKKRILLITFVMIFALSGCDEIDPSGLIDMMTIQDTIGSDSQEESTSEENEPIVTPQPTPEVFESEIEKEAAEIIDDSIKIAIDAVLGNRRKSNPEIMKSTYFEPFQEDNRRLEHLNDKQKDLFWKLLRAGQNREDLLIKESEYGDNLLIDYLTISTDLERYDPFLECFYNVNILGKDFFVEYYDPHRDANFCVERDSEEWEQMVHDMDLLDAILSRVVKKMPEELSTYEKYYYLASVVSARVTYTLETRNKANAFGALVDGQALCEGYSEAFYLLCKKADLACYLQDGITPESGHAWNLIVLEGGTYHVDVTWSDGYEPGSWNWERYFAMTDEESINSGHELREGRPATGEAFY